MEYLFERDADTIFFTTQHSLVGSSDDFRLGVADRDSQPCPADHRDVVPAIPKGDGLRLICKKEEGLDMLSGAVGLCVLENCYAKPC